MNQVVVVDYGSQYTPVLVRVLRERGADTISVPSSLDYSQVGALRPAGLVLSGGPASAESVGGANLKDVLGLGVPVLGICYGMQLIAEVLGGRVAKRSGSEYGPQQITSVNPQTRLLRGVAAGTRVWMSHMDSVVVPPPDFVVTASTNRNAIAALEHEVLPLFGVQFHPELMPSKARNGPIDVFLDIARPDRMIGTSSLVRSLTLSVRAQVGRGHAMCAVSGGVDSSVAAVLTQRAIGERAFCCFIDTGLLRHGELRALNRLEPQLKAGSIVILHREDAFLRALSQVDDPELKRRRFAQEYANSLGAVTHPLSGRRPTALVQGTLCSDVVESGGDSRATIKSHHNVIGVPPGMQPVEPLRELFKDEVRALGREIGVDPQILSAQPFPGPGLAIRTLGCVTRERLVQCRHADLIVREEIEKRGLAKNLWAYFAVLLPPLEEDGKEVRVVVRCVESTDAMTATASLIAGDVLGAIAKRMSAVLGGEVSVFYDLTSKPPATIDWE